MQAKLGELVGEIKLAVEEEDFEKAAALKKEAAILKDSLKTMIGVNGDDADSALRISRCLRLCALMLGRFAAQRDAINPLHCNNVPKMYACSRAQL